MDTDGRNVERLESKVEIEKEIAWHGIRKARLELEERKEQSDTQKAGTWKGREGL